MNILKCSGWSVCGLSGCQRYAPHLSKFKIGYCDVVAHFVEDRIIDADMECDPNLAFRVRRGEDVFGDY